MFFSPGLSSNSYALPKRETEIHRPFFRNANPGTQHTRRSVLMTVINTARELGGWGGHGTRSGPGRPRAREAAALGAHAGPVTAPAQSALQGAGGSRDSGTALRGEKPRDDERAPAQDTGAAVPPSPGPPAGRGASPLERPRESSDPEAPLGGWRVKRCEDGPAPSVIAKR